MLNIETRSEGLLIAHLQPLLTAYTLHSGFTGENITTRPYIAVICPSVTEAISHSGIYNAVIAIEVRTRLVKDSDKTTFAGIIDTIRTALQQRDIVASLNALEGVHTVHGVDVAESQTELEGQDRVWTQALDVKWSPTA